LEYTLLDYRSERCCSEAVFRPLSGTHNKLKAL